MAHYKHGESKSSGTKEYRAFRAMKGRCRNPNLLEYHRYGGRGIKVCKRWLNKKKGFQYFIKDVGRAPSPQHSLNRIDNNKDYSPNNCEWATQVEQMKNSSRAVLITSQGVTDTINGWARRTGLKRRTIGMRINQYNWPPERAILVNP